MEELAPRVSWWNLRRTSEKSDLYSNVITESVRKIFEGKDGIRRFVVIEEKDPIVLEWHEGTPSGVRTGKIESAYLTDEGYNDVRDDLPPVAEKATVAQIVCLHGNILLRCTSGRNFVISMKKLYAI